MPGKTRAKGKKNRVQTKRRRGKPQSKLSSLYTPRGIYKLAAISSVLAEKMKGSNEKLKFGPKSKTSKKNVRFNVAPGIENHSQKKPTDALFVCTGNTCRSQAAHGVAEALNSIGKYESRGLKVRNPKKEPAPRMRKSVRETFGKNVLGRPEHYSRQIGCQDIEDARVTFVMNEKDLNTAKALAKKCGYSTANIQTIDNKSVIDPFFCLGTNREKTCYNEAFNQLHKATKRQLSSMGRLKQNNTQKKNKSRMRKSKGMKGQTRGRGKRSKK
jgi:protein-tyrosine-phosphatase